jgi:hypothetical protein
MIDIILVLRLFNFMAEASCFSYSRVPFKVALNWRRCKPTINQHSPKNQLGDCAALVVISDPRRHW